MTTRRLLTITALAACSATAFFPSAANAACANVPFSDLVKVADVIATAEFLPGAADENGTLRTPARARIRRYDQGRGPRELSVSTGLGAPAFGSESINPKAGEVWRLYGSLSPNRTFGTSVCAGSVVVPTSAASASAAVIVGGKRRSLVPSTTDGRPHKGRLPAVRLPRRGNVILQASSPVHEAAAAQAVAVRLVTPGRATRTLRVKWSGRSISMRGRLPKLKVGKKGSTLVIVTREASLAFGLRRPA